MGWALVAAALGALAAASVALAFIIGSWRGIDRRHATRNYAPRRSHEEEPQP